MESEPIRLTTEDKRMREEKIRKKTAVGLGGEVSKTFELKEI